MFKAKFSHIHWYYKGTQNDCQCDIIELSTFEYTKLQVKNRNIMFIFEKEKVSVYSPLINGTFNV